jgi:uncharacterized protein YjbJ (UPF0337 family)
MKAMPTRGGWAKRACTAPSGTGSACASAFARAEAPLGNFASASGSCVRRRTDPTAACKYLEHVLQARHVDVASANQCQEQIMGINKDQVKGRAEEASGKVKEVVGKVVGDKKLEVKGNIEKNVGAARASFGDAKSNIDKGFRKS